MPIRFWIYLALAPLTGFLAWRLTSREVQFSRTISQMSLLLVVAALAALIFTGALRSQGLTQDIHRITGLLICDLVCLAVPFILGALFQQRLKKRPLEVSLYTLCLLLLVGVVILSSLTGYMKPTDDGMRNAQLSEQRQIDMELVRAESLNRFKILHFYLFPSVVLVLLGCWYRALPIENTKPD